MSLPAVATPNPRRLQVPRLAALSFALLACATPSGGGPALLLVTDTYELHLRDGTIFVHRDGLTRPLADYDELHALYRRQGEALVPSAPDGGTTSVLGWRDLECVRAAQTCGREPDRPARDMFRLRLRF